MAHRRSPTLARDQIENFDPTAFIEAFGLEDEDANQHDHLKLTSYIVYGREIKSYSYSNG